MSVQVLFRDFKRSLAIDNYLSEQARAILQKYISKEDGYSVDVLVGEVKRRNLPGSKPQFSCEVRVSIDGEKKVYKARKIGYDFYACVNEAAEAVNKILRRHHSKMVKSRRRRLAPQLAFINSPDPAAVAV